jgi:hypothetical protein
MLKNVEEFTRGLELKFATKLMDLVSDFLQKEIENSDSKDFRKYLKSIINGETYYSPKQREKNPSKRISFITDLFYLYSELAESYQRLQLTYILIKKLKYSEYFQKVGIKRVELLRYHYENFISELYIFKARATLIFRRIEKTAQKLGFYNESKLINNSCRKFSSCFENIDNVRGKHVHLRRYTDDKFKQLESLEFLRILDPFKSNEMLGLYSKSVFNEKKKDILKNVELNIENVKKVTDLYLAQIIDVTFTRILEKL